MFNTRISNTRTYIVLAAAFLLLLDGSSPAQSDLLPSVAYSATETAPRLQAVTEVVAGGKFSALQLSPPDQQVAQQDIFGPLNFESLKPIGALPPFDITIMPPSSRLEAPVFTTPIFTAPILAMPGFPTIALPAPNIQTSVQLPLKGKTIVVNAGHGGKDTGATYGGYHEKNVNLAIALKVRNLLTSYGATVVMTRTDDRFMSLPAIDEVTSRVRPDAFLAIHCNAGQKKMHGIESFYFYPESAHYASLMLKYVSQKMEKTPNFVHQNNFFVIDHTRVPAALVEVGYLSNQHDRAYLTNSRDQDTIAIALAEGLVRFLTGADAE